MFSKFLLRFCSGTMVSRLAGFAREVIMATLFGASATVAGFWMAFRFSQLLRRFFGEGALHVSFVPHFVLLRQKDPQKADQFFFELTLLILYFLAACLIITEIILGGLVLFGNLAAENYEIVLLTMILLPSLIFTTLYALNVAFLNSENRYFVASLAPAIVNLIWILSALIFSHKLPLIALERVGICIVVGSVLQYFLTLPRSLSFFRSLNYPHAFRHEIRKEIFSLFKPFFFAIIGVTSTQINSLCDAIFARAADPGGPAYLWYAIRLQQLPFALFGVGIASVLLPNLSKATFGPQREQLLNGALKQASALMIPMSGFFLILGESLVWLVYGHGKFSTTAVIESTGCLHLYGIGLLPMSFVLILATWFYVQKKTLLPALCAFGAVGMNLFLNAIFVFFFGWGSGSIALATTLSSCFNVILLLIFILKQGAYPFEGFGNVVIKTLLCTLCAMGASFKVLELMGDSCNLWQQFLCFSLPAACFGLIFLGSAYLFRLRQITEVFDIFLRRHFV